MRQNSHSMAPKHFKDLKLTPPPRAWGVSVGQDALGLMARRLRGHRFASPNFEYPGVPPWQGRSWLDFCIAGTSVVWCLWPPTDEQMWRTRLGDDWLEDAPGIWACFTRFFPERINLDAIPRPELFFEGVGTLQMLPERGQALIAAIEALETHWDGSAVNLLEEAGFEASEIAEILIATVPGFFDRPESPEGVLPFDKLAHLAVAMMAARSPVPVTGLERFPVYPDYMLPRHLRHAGVLVYDPELADTVDRRELIAENSQWEHAIRWATIFAAEKLREGLTDLGKAVTTPQLDYYLWWESVLGPSAAEMGEHHRTVTQKY